MWTTRETLLESMGTPRVLGHVIGVVCSIFVLGMMFGLAVASWGMAP